MAKVNHKKQANKYVLFACFKKIESCAAWTRKWSTA